MRRLRLYIRLLIVLLLCVIIFTLLRKSEVTYSPSKEYSQEEVQNAFSLLNDDLIDNELIKKRFTYVDFLKTVNIDANLTDISAELTNENKIQDNTYDGIYMTLNKDEIAAYEVDVNQAGFYHIQLDYLSDTDSLNNITFSVSINDEYQFDESKVIHVPMRWEDSTKDFIKDSYGDETLPTQIKIKEWDSLYFYNNTYYTVEPLYFSFNQGINTIKIENIASDSIKIGQLKLIAPKEIPTYDEYKTNISSHGEYKEYINSTLYVEKNSSFIRMNTVKEPTLKPVSNIDKKLNVIDGVSWKNSGQELVYEIEVPKTGNYKLAFYYRNSKNDFSVFRTFRVNGEIPFQELKAYEFEMTKGNDWSLEVLSDSNNIPFEFYFEGNQTYYLSIRADSEPVSEYVRNIQLILDHINQFSLEIIKITGKEVDKNRTWDIVKYIPETDAYLEAYEILIKDMINALHQYAPNKEESSTLSYLQKALHTLNELREYPGKLPVYLEDLSGGSGSVAQMLGDSIRMLNEQPLSLDGFYVYNTADIEKPDASFFKRIRLSLSSFFSSFTTNKYNPTHDPEVIDVWVNRPITYVDLMQKMIDSDFTPQTGIKVKVSVMPDPNKLILASAANEAPDVALGLASYMPFDLAIRGAAYDLSSLEDFWKTAGDFAPGAFIPYVLDGKVYALPETLDFHSLIYRKDTFSSLQLDVPDTWEDVIEILPELQRYGMNFYHPIAGGGALKWFYQTSALIYQHNGSIYSPDGLSTNIDSKNSVEALTFLNSLFTTYSLPEQVPNFYDSFRYNELPVGIVDFNTYLQIKNAAPELIGQWELAPYPGTVQDDDSISRWYIANGSAGVIMKDTEKPNESWDFMRWWMSTNTQTNFANTLQSTYGPEYVWLSGNLEAVEGSPIEKEHLDIILEQVKWLHDVPRTPGQYMLERGISDIWNTAVFDNTPTGVAIDEQVIIINREITKKMTEFGYLDTNGDTVKKYKIYDISWIKNKMEEARE